MVKRTYPLIHEPWKIKFNLEPGPTACLVSLFDLIFYEETTVNTNGVVTKTPYLRLKENAVTRRLEYKGLCLDHDLILFNSNIYDDSSNLINTNANAYGETWNREGIELGKVEYDPRALGTILKKSEFGFPSNLQYISISRPLSANTSNLTVFSKDAALFPSTSKQILDAAMNQTASPEDQKFNWSEIPALASNLELDLGYTPTSVGTISLQGNNLQLRSIVGLVPDILLGDPDEIFNQQLDEQTRKAYTTICLSPYSGLVYTYDEGAAVGTSPWSSDQSMPRRNMLATIICDLLQCSYDDSVAKYFTSIGQSGQKYYSEQNCENLLTLLNLTSVREALKQMYIWVKASFYGDYVDPRSFEQDLTPQSNVRYKNIMASSVGNYKRFDEILTRDFSSNDFLINKEYFSEESLPYLAQTQPSMDLLSKKIVPGYSNEGLNNSQNLQPITDALKNANNNIGKMYTETINKSSKKLLSSIGYLDPDLNYVDSTLAFGDQYFPVILPKAGNAYFDGRIISPTIDELWHYIKRLIEGRVADTNIIKDLPENTSTLDTLVDRAEILNKGSISRTVDDTRIPVTKNFIFLDKDSKQRKGDPLSQTIVEQTTSGLQDNRVVADFFISTPNSVAYTIYSGLKQTTNEIINYVQNEIVGKGVYPITLWNRKPFKLVENLAYKQDEKGNVLSTRLEENVILSSESAIKTGWELRTNPLSLRELEAQISQNKYNLLSFANYIKRIYPLAGCMIPQLFNKEEGFKNNIVDLHSGGSLAQFHRFYDFDPEPNLDPQKGPVGGPTIYNPRGSKFTQRVEFTDDPTYGKDPYPVTKFTNITRENYGSSNHVYSKNLFDSGGVGDTQFKTDFYIDADDVYMSASGKWMYKFDRIRVPVLDSDF